MRWFLLIQPGSGASFDDLTGFALDNPEWPGIFLLRRNAEAELSDETAAADIAAWFKRFGPTSAKGWAAYARALRATGEAASVPRLIRSTWRSGRMSRADQAEFRTTFAALLRPGDHVVRLRMLLANRRSRRAAERLLAAVRIPAAERNVLALRIRMQKRRSDADDSAISDGLARLTAAQRQEEGFLLDEIRWLLRQERYDDAAAKLRLGPSSPAYSRRWLTERTILAYGYLEKKKAPAAYATVADHRQPGGYGQARTEFLAGWIALRWMKKPAAALGHFRTLLSISRFSISRARGAYWIARAHAAAGKPDLARAWYRTAAEYTLTFYGQLAIQHIEKAKILLPKTSPVDAKLRASFEKEDLVVAAHLFTRLDEKGAAKLVLWHLVSKAQEPARMQLVSALAHDLNQAPLGVRAARRAIIRQHPAIDGGYPTLGYARHAKVERALIHAIIRQESEFDPDAVSPSNARGLMQLLPGTARQMARTLRTRYSLGRLTANPRYNVRLGSAYLDYLLRRFGGAYVLAIAAYNAGPRRVAGWIAANGDPRNRTLDIVDWMELVPISETRNYLQRVLENLAVYRALFGKPALGRDLRKLWTSPAYK